MVEKASKKGGPKNARALSDLAILSAHGSDKTLRELPEAFQQRFLGALNTPKGLSASKAQERTDKILDTPLGDLISNYGGGDTIFTPADPEIRNVRREGLQNLINHPETPEEIKPHLQKQLDLLERVEPLRQKLAQAKTAKEKDDLNRAIEQERTKLQEEIDPRGFGDAYRTFNEQKGVLESGVAGQLEDPRTEKDRGLYGPKSKHTWSLGDPEQITLETLKRHAVNSNQGHLLQETKDMDVEEARAYLQHQMGLRTSSSKTFESSKRLSDPMKSIPSWGSQAELAADSPVPRTAQIGEPDMSDVQFPHVSEHGMYGPEGMKPNLKRSQLKRIERLDEAIQSGTHLDDPELRQEFADRITHEVIGNIRGEKEKSNLVSEMDFDRLIQDEMPNERSTINSDLSNLSSNFREQGNPQNIANISGDLEEGESAVRAGVRRAENRLSDMQRHALINHNAKAVDNLVKSLRVHNGDDDPSIDVFVQNWMNNNAETLRNAGADTGMIANLITKDYYNHLQTNGLIDVPERSPFTASFGRYDNDKVFRVKSPQEADEITADTNNAGLLAQSATQAITDLEAGKYQQVLQNSQNTQVLTGLETDARSIKRRIQELEDTLAETTDQNDQVLLNSNLIQLRHELSKTESQTAQLRNGLGLNTNDKKKTYLSPEESLAKYKELYGVRPEIEATLNFSAAPSTDPKIGVIPGLKKAYDEWLDYENKIQSGTAKDYEQNIYGKLESLMRGRSDALVAMMDRIPTRKGKKLEITQQQTMGRFGAPEPSQQITVKGFKNLDDVLAAAENYRRSTKQYSVHVMSDDVKTGTNIGHKYADGSYNTSVIHISINKIDAKNSGAEIQRLAKEAGLEGFNVNPETGSLELYYVGNGTEEHVAQWNQSVRAFDKELLKGGYRGSDTILRESGIRASFKRLYDLHPESSWSKRELGNYNFGSSGRGPIPGARELSALSTELEGLSDPDFSKLSQRPIDTSRSQQIADNYDFLPVNDLENPAVSDSYDALAEAIGNQYAYSPYEMVLGNELYENSDQMRADTINSGRMKIYQTTPDTFGPQGYDFSGHPFLEEMPFTVNDLGGNPVTPVKNDVFRYIHDLIAHGTNPNQFGPLGEEAAARTHAATLPYEAIPALMTETRGQNSWVNFSKNPSAKDPSMTVAEWNRKNRKDTEFAMQKAALMPLEHVLTGDPEIDAEIIAYYQAHGLV